MACAISAGVEGRSVVIERRSADGQSGRAPAIMAELVTRGVDAIVVNPSLWLLQAAQRATKVIPIVALFPGGDPAAAGLIVSLARPGGNLTGVTGTVGREVVGKQLQLLKELAPGIARVGVLGPPRTIEGYQAMADRFGVTGIFAEVESTEQFDAAFAVIAQAKVDALHVLGSPVNFNRGAEIVAFAADQRLPTMFNNRESVEAGGLLSYGPSFAGIYRQLAAYVDQILKGAKPSDLPVQRPVRFETMLNLKTAKALGLEVPTLELAQADEVIE